jgi:hypothetical protein
MKLNLTEFQGNVSQNHHEVPLSPTSENKKRENSEWWGCGDTVSANANGTATMYQSSNPLKTLGVQQTEVKTHVQIKTYT